VIGGGKEHQTEGMGKKMRGWSSRKSGGKGSGSSLGLKTIGLCSREKRENQRGGERGSQGRGGRGHPRWTFSSSVRRAFEVAERGKEWGEKGWRRDLNV